jgi:hypothetical protein
MGIGGDDDGSVCFCGLSATRFTKDPNSPVKLWPSPDLQNPCESSHSISEVFGGIPISFPGDDNGNDAFANN